MAGKPGDPEDGELDPPLADETEPEDLQDQQLVDDEADEAPEPDQIDARQQPDQPDQRPQPSRGERRFQTLTNELQEQRRRNDDLNRRLDAILAGQQSRPQGESLEARAQRLAMLTPEERLREELNEAKTGFAREIQQMRYATIDGNDKAAYSAKATVDPLYKNWEARVEAELATLRNQGMNAEREKVMFYLIGKDAVEKRQANAPRQRAEAQRRITRQQARPSNSGSDIAASRRTRGDSLERRLENVEL